MGHKYKTIPENKSSIKSRRHKDVGLKFEESTETYDGLNYDELLVKFKQEVKEFEFVRKKQIILVLAKKLDEAGQEKETICEKLTEDLKGYGFHGRYIRGVLPDEYKQKNKARESAAASAANISEPIELSVTKDGRSQAEPVEIDYDKENKSIYENSHNNEPKPQQSPAIITLTTQLAEKEDTIQSQALRIGQLEEQLREQKNQIQELIKSANNFATVSPNKDVTESPAYKALESERDFLKQQADELRVISGATVATSPAFRFQNASGLKRESEKQLLEMDIRALRKFFKDSRNCKKTMYLQVSGNKIVGWESDAER